MSWKVPNNYDVDNETGLTIIIDEGSKFRVTKLITL